MTEPLAVLKHQNGLIQVTAVLTEGMADAQLATVAISSPTRTIYRSDSLIDGGPIELGERFREACKVADAIRAEIVDAEAVNRSESRVVDAPDSHSE